MTQISELELWEKVAAKLTGLPSVTVRLQQPIYPPPVNGSAYKTRDGKAVVDVAPGPDQLHVFLHEVGHLKAEFSTMAATDFWKMQPGTLLIAPSLRKAVAHPRREDKAEQWAKHWLQYADLAAKHYGTRETSELHRRLLALLDYGTLPAWKANELTSAAAQHALKTVKIKR